MLSCSVIICTRNPREDYFRRVLEALRSQTLAKDKWELLLLSVAAEGALGGRFDLSWHPNARFILEENPGKNHSLLRGIAESKSDLLVIVDDDNVLRSDYLQNALKISALYPFLGAWGCSYIPEFEIEPPVDLRPHLGGLLIEKRTVAVWSKIPFGNEALPPGGGMVVRKRQALFYREQVLNNPLRNSLGPNNKPPRGGEDSDLALCAFQLDLGTGMFPELELTHLIPARKLTLKYLENLWESFGYGGIILRAAHDPEGLSEISFPSRIRTKPIKPSMLKSLLLGACMLVTGSSRAERRIRLAKERGCIRAYRDLQALKA
ncbi:MAG TPA: glycosyltransferase [Candidatus Sulfotelmatobacter sp.]|nr:glycosyltransferase [Candidatus Sulfotelmatobacter sp.]